MLHPLIRSQNLRFFEVSFHECGVSQISHAQVSQLEICLVAICVNENSMMKVGFAKLGIKRATRTKLAGEFRQSGARAHLPGFAEDS